MLPAILGAAAFGSLFLLGQPLVVAIGAAALVAVAAFFAVAGRKRGLATGFRTRGRRPF